MKNVHLESCAEALETLKMATEAARVGVWDLNFLSGELHLSELCREIFGFTASADCTRHDLEKLTFPADRKHVAEGFAAALHPGGPDSFDLEYRILRPSGELRWIAVKGRCLFVADHHAPTAVRMLGTVLDRTEAKASQHALLQAEQLAATGRLAASIAHEINNPLEAMTNLLYLVRGETDPLQRDTYLALAEAELARVSEITVNTLRFFRDPAGLTEVHVPDLLHSVLSLFHGRIALKGVAIHLRLQDETRLETAQGELRQVLVNIISNALDALPRGGLLRVRCRRFSSTVGRRQPGVGICIADTGHGMTPEVLKRIFDPFYTTKGSTGTGLGLWLSMELLKKHGYRIRVKSKPAHGTTFSLFLPQVSALA